MRLLISCVRDPGPCQAEVTLPFELRVRSRLLMRSSAGEELGMLRERDSPPLDDGDVLVASDGYRVRVRAAAEALIEVRAHSPEALARAAYHLGNRHVQVEVGTGWLRLAQDAVLEAMLVRLGAVVTHTMAAFRPEHGAYGGGHHHSHGAHGAKRAAPRIHEFGTGE